MKNCENVLKEYARRLNDEDLKFVYFRLSQKLCGDRGEVAEFISQVKEIDRWLQSAGNCTEFFDMLDQLTEFVGKEYNHRFEKAD